MSSRVDVWGGRAQVICHFEEVSPHAHAVGAVLASLDGRFELHTAHFVWTDLHAAFVPPGLRHSLRVHGQRLAVLFLSPGMLDLRGLARAQDLDVSRAQRLSRQCRLVRYLNACWDDEIPDEDVQEQLADFLGGAAPDRLCEDERVELLLNPTLVRPQEAERAWHRASTLGLSPSRARQLFREHLGISWQQLRRWQRMRMVSGCLSQGASLTTAAHQLGFSDSAQLSRDFRGTFGVAPSLVYGQAKVRAHGLVW